MDVWQYLLQDTAVAPKTMNEKLPGFPQPIQALCAFSLATYFKFITVLSFDILYSNLMKTQLNCATNTVNSATLPTVWLHGTAPNSIDCRV